MAIQPVSRNSDPADEAFLRALTFPEEDRSSGRRHPGGADSGGLGRPMSYRWRSGGIPPARTNSFVARRHDIALARPIADAVLEVGAVFDRAPCCAPCG